MKHLRPILAIAAAGSLCMACEDFTSTVKVQNKVSKSEISNIKWGNESWSSPLLPGETSSQREFDEYSRPELPLAYKLSFTLSSNGSKVYLETRRTYKLDKDEDLIIVIEDTTAIINPLVK